MKSAVVVPENLSGKIVKVVTSDYETTFSENVHIDIPVKFKPFEGKTFTSAMTKVELAVEIAKAIGKRFSAEMSLEEFLKDAVRTLGGTYN